MNRALVSGVCRLWPTVVTEGAGWGVESGREGKGGSGVPLPVPAAIHSYLQVRDQHRMNTTTARDPHVHVL